MSNARFTIHVNEDSSITIPAFTARGLGYTPFDEVHLVVPVEQPDCGFRGCNELYLGRHCEEVACTGYTADGSEVNLPPRLFSLSGVSVGAEVQVLAGDGALVLVAGSGICEDLPDEISELLDELGIKTTVSVPLGCDF